MVPEGFGVKLEASQLSQMRLTRLNCFNSHSPADKLLRHLTHGCRVCCLKYSVIRDRHLDSIYGVYYACKVLKAVLLAVAWPVSLLQPKVPERRGPRVLELVLFCLVIPTASQTTSRPFATFFVDLAHGQGPSALQRRIS